MRTIDREKFSARLDTAGTALTEAIVDRMSEGVSHAGAVRTPEVIGEEIRSLVSMANRTTVWFAVEIGRRLTEAKDLVGHGGWMEFLQQETQFSASTAQNLMKVYREYGGQSSLFGAELANSQTFGNLSYTKALALLALPEEERADFVAEADVESMSTRELQEAIRARDEAQRALQTSESRLADTQRELSLAQKKETDLIDRLKKAQEDIAASDSEAQAIAENVKKLELQIKELEARPQPVAMMEADKEALDKARAEAVAEMQGKLDKAKERAAKAEEKRKVAEDALAEANEKLEVAKTQQAAAVISSDKELATFDLLFQQTQEKVNAMHGILLLVRGRGDEAQTGMLQKALLALSEAIKGAAT